MIIPQKLNLKINTSNPYSKKEPANVTTKIDSSTGRRFRILTYDIYHNPSWKFLASLKALAITLFKGLFAICSKKVRKEIVSEWTKVRNGREIIVVKMELPKLNNISQSIKAEKFSETVKPSTMLDESSQKLLNQLLENPKLQEYYQQTKNDTDKLLITIQNSRRKLNGLVNPLVTWEELQLFLVLVSLSKAIPVQNKDKKIQLIITNDELNNAKQLALEIFKQSKIDSNKVKLFEMILKYDTENLYQNEIIGIEEAVSHITEISKELNLPTDHIYSLLHAIYRLQNPSTEKNEKLFEELLHQLIEVDEGKVCYDRLMGLYKEGKDKEAEQYFLDNLTVLLSYLKDMHQKMLSLDNAKTTPTEIHVFRDIKISFSNLYVFFAKNSMEPKNVIFYYEDEMKRHLELKKSDQTYFHPFINSGKLSYSKIQLVNFFQDELKNFRRNYLCRFSVEKVQKAILHENNRRISFDSFPLLKTTFLHGTNSSLFPNLAVSDFHLLSSGRLVKENIVPFSGELNKGSQDSGINQHNISGTTLDNAEIAIEYAESFRSSLTLEEKLLNSFIKEKRRKNSFYNHVGDTYKPEMLTRLSFAILRLRTLAPEKITDNVDLLKQIIKKMKESFSSFKKSEEYKKYMPVSKDLDGTLGYQYQDEHYYDVFTNTEKGIEAIEKAISSPIIVPADDRNDILQSFPVLFGSTTLHAFSLKWEMLVGKAAKIGKDLQFIIVNAENVDKTKEFLQKHSIEGVTIYTMDHFKEAMQLNKLASKYFADYASSKKLAAIAINLT